MHDKSEQVRETIKFNTELLKILVLLSIATTTGVLSLVKNGINQNKILFVFAFLGVGIIVASVLLAIFVFIDNKKLLRKL